VVVAAIGFGTLGPASRIAADAGLTSSAFAAWRAIIAAIALSTLVAVLWWRGRPPRILAGFDRRTWLALGVASVCNVTLNLSIFAAFERIPIAVALAGFYTFPAMVAIAGVVLGREPLGLRRLAALALALVGMLLVVGVADGEAGPADWVGVGLALVAAASQTVFLTISRTEYRDVPPGEVGAITSAASGLVMAVVAIVAGGVGAMSLPLTASGTWPPILWAGIIGAGVPYLLLISGIRLVGSTSAAILMLFEPLTGAVLAAALLAETLTTGQVAGGALILVAAVLLQRTRTPSTVPEGPARTDGYTRSRLPP
jgi:drug/metabolite transporter (DMT)-like permease